jgi:hypothetical protein
MDVQLLVAIQNLVQSPDAPKETITAEVIKKTES